MRPSGDQTGAKSAPTEDVNRLAEPFSTSKKEDILAQPLTTSERDLLPIRRESLPAPRVPSRSDPSEQRLRFPFRCDRTTRSLDSGRSGASKYARVPFVEMENGVRVPDQHSVCYWSRISRDFQALEVKRLRHQRGIANKQQVSRRRVTRSGVDPWQQPPLLRIEAPDKEVPVRRLSSMASQ